MAQTFEILQQEPYKSDEENDDYLTKIEFINKKNLWNLQSDKMLNLENTGICRLKPLTTHVLRQDFKLDTVDAYVLLNISC